MENGFQTVGAVDCLFDKLTPSQVSWEGNTTRPPLPGPRPRPHTRDQKKSSFTSTSVASYLVRMIKEPCPYCGQAIELTDEDVVRGDVATCPECDRDSRIKRNEGGRFSMTLVPLDD